jgi:hypothetical protein
LHRGRKHDIAEAVREDSLGGGKGLTLRGDM